jgi:hypothetical protein
VVVIRTFALTYAHAPCLTPVQQDTNHAPGPARSRHAECAPPCRETQRALLRALRAQARGLAIQRRRNMLHKLHGEIHGRMEHSVEAVRRTDTEGEPGWRGAAGLVDFRGVGDDDEVGDSQSKSRDYDRQIWKTLA